MTLHERLEQLGYEATILPPIEGGDYWVIWVNGKRADGKTWDEVEAKILDEIKDMK